MENCLCWHVLGCLLWICDVIVHSNVLDSTESHVVKNIWLISGRFPVRGVGWRAFCSRTWTRRLLPLQGQRRLAWGDACPAWKLHRLFRTGAWRLQQKGRNWVHCQVEGWEVDVWVDAFDSCFAFVWSSCVSHLFSPCQKAAQMDIEAHQRLMDAACLWIYIKPKLKDAVSNDFMAKIEEMWSMGSFGWF